MALEPGFEPGSPVFLGQPLSSHLWRPENAFFCLCEDKKWGEAANDEESVFLFIARQTPGN